MSIRCANDDIALLAKRLSARDRGALARLLTLAARGADCAQTLKEGDDAAKRKSPVIALTGGGGVGKSSLLGALVALYAARGEFVGVLACDPESSVTGGALLGDRCRIVGTASSERIFIRSLPAASGQQGLAQNIDAMLGIMQAFGFDRIFVETVGAGQGDVAVRSIANVVVLVLQPQTGDELQWEKAGVLEIADILVVNKGDLPGSDQTLADILEQVRSPKGQVTPVIKTSVARNEGIVELCEQIELALREIAHAKAQRREEEKESEH
jgi:LAO/AO transport system ATPase